MQSVRTEDDRRKREYMAQCLKVLSFEEKNEDEFVISVIKDGIATFEKIVSPEDLDLFLLAKLYIDLSSVYCKIKNRAKYSAALHNAKTALNRCVSKNDEYLRNVVYLKSHEAKQERYFPELKAESQAALDEAFARYKEIKLTTDQDAYELVVLHLIQLDLHEGDTAKKIATLLTILAVLEQIKDKSTPKFERETIYVRIELAKQYRVKSDQNYQLALEQVRAGIAMLEANPAKKDRHYAELSLLYHNLAMDLCDLKSPKKEIKQAFLKALEVTDKIKNKTDADYRGVIKTWYCMANFYRETNQQYLFVDYIIPFFKVLGSIQRIRSTTLMRAEAIIRLMAEMTFTDKPLIDVLYFANKAVSEYTEPLMSSFIAFLQEFCLRSPHLVTRQSALVTISFINYLLNGTENKTLPDNDFKVRLEAAAAETSEVLMQDELEEVDEISLLKQFRTILQEHPIHNLVQQLENSMPVTVAMAVRIKQLEADNAALRAEVAASRAISVESRPESSEPAHKKHAVLFKGRP